MSAPEGKAQPSKPVRHVAYGCPVDADLVPMKDGSYRCADRKTGLITPATQYLLSETGPRRYEVTEAKPTDQPVSARVAKPRPTVQPLDTTMLLFMGCEQGKQEVSTGTGPMCMDENGYLSPLVEIRIEKPRFWLELPFVGPVEVYGWPEDFGLPPKI